MVFFRSQQLLVLIEVSLLTSLVPSGHSSLSTTSCPSSLQPLISGPVYRVEDDQFRASSSYDGDYLPHDARITSGSWCSANVAGPHWIEVDFGTNVIIHQLQMERSNGNGVNSDLTKFEVEFGPINEQLLPILQDDSTETKVFTKSNENDFETTTLPSPIVTQILRINAVEWTQSVPCVTLEVLGCIQVPGCDSDVILSTNRSLLPLSSITATSALVDTPAYGVVGEASNDKWCTSEPLRQGAAPYIMFTFTERVVLTYMRARGGPAGVSYVTRFSVDVRDNDSQSFTSYTLLTDEEAQFSTVGAGVQTYTFWNQPLQGKTFRFKIKDGQRNYLGAFCWKVQLLGCVVSEQGLSPMPTQTTPNVTTSFTQTPTIEATTIETQTITVQTTPTGNGTDIEGARLGYIIGGVVGGFILLLFIIVIMVLLVVCLAVKNKASKERLASVQLNNRDTATIKMVNNVLYGNKRDSYPIYAIPDTLKRNDCKETPAVYSYVFTNTIRIPNGSTHSRPGTLKGDTSHQSWSKRFSVSEEREEEGKAGDGTMKPNVAYGTLQRTQDGGVSVQQNDMIDNSAYESPLEFQISSSVST